MQYKSVQDQNRGVYTECIRIRKVMYVYAGLVSFKVNTLSRKKHIYDNHISMES